MGPMREGTAELSGWCRPAHAIVTRHRPVAHLYYQVASPGLGGRTSHNNLRWCQSQALLVYLRIVQSRRLQITVFALLFPIQSSLSSRVRDDVAALGLRAQATEMTSHSHRRTTVTTKKTCGPQIIRLTLRLSLSSHNLYYLFASL